MGRGFERMSLEKESETSFLVLMDAAAAKIPQLGKPRWRKT